MSASLKIVNPPVASEWARPGPDVSGPCHTADSRAGPGRAEHSTDRVEPGLKIRLITADQTTSAHGCTLAVCTGPTPGPFTSSRWIYNFKKLRPNIATSQETILTVWC